MTLALKVKGRVVISATRHYELLVLAFHAHCGESYTNHYSNHAKQWYKPIQALCACINVSHGTTTGAISNCAQAIRECICDYVE